MTKVLELRRLDGARCMLQGSARPHEWDAVEPALTKVADLFHQETNNQVTLACNAGPAIKKRIQDGEVADVVVVEPDFVEALTKSSARWG